MRTGIVEYVPDGKCHSMMRAKRNLAPSEKAGNDQQQLHHPTCFMA